MQDISCSLDAPKLDPDSARVVQIKRQRGLSSWPFGPVGVREERRKPFRANEMSLANTPRRRSTDLKPD